MLATSSVLLVAPPGCQDQHIPLSRAHPVGSLGREPGYKAEGLWPGTPAFGQEGPKSQFWSGALLLTNQGSPTSALHRDPKVWLMAPQGDSMRIVSRFITVQHWVHKEAP